MPVPFALEQQVAIAAVRRACALTTAIFNKLVAGETLVKGDKSPVTVGDYSAQAVINTILSQAFPEDPIVGEEDATDLRAPNETSQALCARIVQLADDILAQPPSPSSFSSSSPDSNSDIDGEGERAEWGLGRRWGADALLKAIDRGNHPGGRSGRMWTLDPIDGTKGFLRGGQYAVCLALLVDARVELGVMGCPNLPLIPSAYQSTSANININTASGNNNSSTTTPDNASAKPGGAGVLFVAVRGHGVHQLPLLVPSTPQPSATPPPQHSRSLSLKMPRLALHELSFLESVEKAHAALDTNARVAARLNVNAKPVRMDSQAKYAALVRGDGGGGAYLRLPVAGGGRGGEAGGYQEKIWDHATGSLLVEEAGGVITDYRGRPLDFGLGRTLGTNYGVVAARKEVHAQVLEAIQVILAEQEATQDEEPVGEKSLS